MKGLRSCQGLRFDCVTQLVLHISFCYLPFLMLCLASDMVRFVRISGSFNLTVCVQSFFLKISQNSQLSFNYNTLQPIYLRPHRDNYVVHNFFKTQPLNFNGFSLLF